MKKLLLLFALNIMVFGNVYAQYCITPTSYLSITPQMTAQTTPTISSGAAVYLFSAIAGGTYTFSTCGLSTADTYLRLYDASGTMILAADDQCGPTQTNMVWTCTTSGSYSLLLNNYPCAYLSLPTTVVYWVTYPIVPSSGTNSYTVCSGVLFDSGGPTSNYVDNSNGYTTLYPSTAASLMSVSGTISGEACCDFFYIYDGVGLGGPLLWSGSAATGNIPTVTSSSGPLTVRFTSDGSVVGTGFTLNTSCVPCIPPAPTSVSAGPSTICYGQSATLSALSTGNGIRWYTTPTGGTLLGTSASGAPFSVTPTTTTTYYAETINAAGCVSATRVPVTVTVNPLPAAPTNVVSTPTAICLGQSSSLSAVSNGNTIHWYQGTPAPGGWEYTTASGASFSVSPSSTQTYYAFVVSPVGCISQMVPVTITVNPSPAAPTNVIASSSTICYGQSTNLSAISTGNTINWYTTPTGGTTLGSSPSGGVFAVAPLVTTTYYAEAISSSGCACNIREPITVYVATPPTATLTTSSTSVCNGTQVNLGGNVTATGAWTLNLSNGQTVSGTGNSSWNVTVTPSTTTTYTISSLTNGSSCTPVLSGSTTISLPISSSTLGVNNDMATCMVNQNGWVHFYTHEGHLLASVNSQGQNLGNVTVTSYVDPVNQVMPACNNLNNPFYSTAVLQRHWVISPTNQPTTPIQVRLPYYPSEVNTLEAIANYNPNPFDDIILLSDLKLSKYSGPNNVDNDALNDCSQTGGNSGITIYAQNNGGTTSSYSNVNTAIFSDYTIPNFSEFWLHGSVDDSPLPITLTDFSVQCHENRVNSVSWTTNSELNTDYFDLERSIDGIVWSKIATLDAAGNSTIVQNYSFIDEHIYESSLYYYRLLQFDQNGIKQEFGPVGSECFKSVESMEIYPNPTDDLVNVILSDSYDLKEISIRILDMNGRELELSNASLEMNGSKITLSLAHFEPGCYFIQCIDNRNSVTNTLKLIRN